MKKNKHTSGPPRSPSRAAGLAVFREIATSIERVMQAHMFARMLLDPRLRVRKKTR